MEQEKAVCEMPLNVYALFISYISKAIFNNQIGLEMIMNYCISIYINKLIKYEIEKIKHKKVQ